jgi:hypothetical protein
MNRNRIGPFVSVTITVVLLVLASSVVALSARGNNPFDEILAKLDEIIESVAPPPTNEEVTMATPPVLMSANHEIVCLIANIGTENLEVIKRIVGADGTVLEEGPLSVPPGHTLGATEPGPGALRCEFTFEGSATSVRATLQLQDAIDSSIIAIIDAK